MAAEEENEEAIFHILVVGFHHQKGCVVEYIHPPLASSPAGGSEYSSLTTQLPQQWRHLPHLALPDGCHNYVEDASFFVLHAPESNGGGAHQQQQHAVYGVACCRQIDSREVEPRADITRSTVQKSLCVLSKYPLFGTIQAKLSQVMQAYFEAKLDFTNDAMLLKTLASLRSGLRLRKIPLDTLQVGLSQQALALKFSHRLLQIFKALLLQRRVLVYGVPTNEVCRTVLGIGSLFPKSLERLSKLSSATTAADDNCGFPLRVFASPFSIQPYLCLQQMDSLDLTTSVVKEGKEEGGAPLLVGVANPLFQKVQSKLCDVYVDLEEGTVQINDTELRSTLYLTAADLRFCDYVTTSVRQVMSPTPPSSPLSPSSPSSSSSSPPFGLKSQSMGWFGSNGWVQSQFKIYLMSLLATSLANQDDRVQEFGRAFMDRWLKSSVYVNWKLSHKKHAGIARVEPVHLCHGDNITFSDLKLRLSAQASEYGVSDRSKEVVGQVLWQTQQVISNVGGAVGGVWSAASSAVSSWWSADGDESD